MPKRLKTGLSALKSRVKVLGVDAIDRRSAPARALVGWRASLVADLGGEESLSAQRMTLVEMATRTCLLLNHIDGWLLAQKSLVIKRRRSLIPAVAQRTALADSLARLLGQLGLDRVEKRIEDLDAFIERRTKEMEEAKNEKPDDH